MCHGKMQSVTDGRGAVHRFTRCHGGGAGALLLLADLSIDSYMCCWPMLRRPCVLRQIVRLS